MNWLLRWPVYPIYGDEYGEFRGIWFQWPVYRRRYAAFKPFRATDFSDAILSIRYDRGLIDEMLRGPLDPHLWSDVTPRDPVKHEWIEDVNLRGPMR